MAKPLNPLPILAEHFKAKGAALLIVAWQEIMGPLANLVSLERIDKHTAIIAIKHPALAQELDALRHLLIDRMNKHLRQQHIQQIRIISATSKKVPRKQVRTTTISKKRTVSLPPGITTLLQDMQDKELATALQQYFIRCADE